MSETAVKSRPIIFGAESVRAILDGRKTMTRRVVKPQAWSYNTDALGQPVLYPRSGPDDFGDPSRPIRRPYDPGSLLWVRETWGYRGSTWTMSDDFDRVSIAYRADDGRAEYRRPHGNNAGIPCQRPQREHEERYEYYDYLREYWKSWRSPIHMPRWAARLWLRVSDVRVERLQEISFDDMRREGALPAYISGGERDFLQREYFRPVWDRLNAKRGYGWDTDPWVWVVTFTPTDSEPEPSE